MFFLVFFFLLVASSTLRSVSHPPTDPYLPLTTPGHTNWTISSSLSPSLLFKPLLSTRRSSLCRSNFHSHKPFSASLILLLSGDICTNPGPIHTQLKLSCANVNSLNKRAPLVESFVRDNGIHLLCLTETKLHESDTHSHVQSLIPPGFTLLRQDRQVQVSTNRGGGVACLTDERFTSSPIPSNLYPSFEHLIVHSDFGKVKLNIITVYRPPTSSVTAFFEHFQSLLSRLVSLKSSFVITGDFNLHLDQTDHNHVVTFNQILTSYNLIQHVTGPTHNLGHTLDLFITNEDSPFSYKVCTTDNLSDHFSITATLDFHIPPIPHKFISYRPIRKINLQLFLSDLTKSELITNPANTVSSLYSQYHSVLSDLLDRHAPIKSKTCPARQRDPWINEEILESKRVKRRCERAWRKSRSGFDRKILSYHTHRYNNLLASAKSDWYTNIIHENKDCPRKLWNNISRILHRSQASPLPDCSDKKDLANSFGSFFNEKINKIRSILNSKDCSGEQLKPNHSPPKLLSFTPVSEDEVSKLILSSSNSSCALDPCPTSLVKDCLHVLITPITNIINMSLSEGIFPDQWKSAHVTPLLKKPNLPKNDLKNYRPVSNLNFISKVTEKVVANQIKDHVNGCGLDNPFQSAYKSFHSTESALLSVQDDIYKAMGNQKVTALTLLDLSAAFDTIDHSILLDRLTDWFGIGGGVLEWIVSYLTERSQTINILGHFSTALSLLFGVPQGSVLGPLLFILYTTPLSQILLNSKDIKHHLYADDTQAYTSFNTSSCDSSLNNLQESLVSAQDWMFTNKLKLNPDKTEFLLIGNQCHRSKFSSKFPIEILGNLLSPSPFARNLGVTMDADFNFQRHINNTVKSCHYHIRDIRRIRKHLTLDSATALANALVSSRLDYCNSLLYAVPAKYLNKLQRVQNSLARVVTMSPRLTSSAPLRNKLHWLPIRSRINFKIALITYKALNFNQPTSINNLLTLRTTTSNTRSQGCPSTKHLLYPSVSGFGRRSFSFASPTVWNDIPSHVRTAPTVASFRKLLKTFYFTHPPVHPS